jgi:RNA polymerase sigma factor (sigma-70 family)
MASLLARLKQDDPDAWDEAFHRLQPVALKEAEKRLNGILRDECKDVFLETFVRLPDKVDELESDEELAPLTKAIARNIATDKWRRHIAAKRGSGVVESLEAIIDAEDRGLAGLSATDILRELNMKDVRELLCELLVEVGEPYRGVLRDYYLDGLSHAEIAEKRSIKIHSVGGYIQRGLVALKALISKKPKLQRELLDAQGPFARRGRVKAVPGELTDEDRLNQTREKTLYPTQISETAIAQLVAHACRRHPERYEAWFKHKQEVRVVRERRQAFEAKWWRLAWRLALLALGCVMVVLLAQALSD